MLTLMLTLLLLVVLMAQMFSWHLVSFVRRLFVVFLSCCAVPCRVAGLATLLACYETDIDPYLENRTYRPDKQRVEDYRDDMRRVRAAQQELASQRALEAKKKLQEKQEQEKTRKNNVAKPKPKGGGNRLGGATANSYNPMQPWSASSGGGGYKATRRTTRRG